MKTCIAERTADCAAPAEKLSVMPPRANVGVDRLLFVGVFLFLSFFPFFFPQSSTTNVCNIQTNAYLQGMSRPELLLATAAHRIPNSANDPRSSTTRIQDGVRRASRDRPSGSPRYAAFPSSFSEKQVS